MPIVGLAARVFVLQNGRPAVDGPRDEMLAHLAGAGPAGRPALVQGRAAAAKS